MDPVFRIDIHIIIIMMLVGEVTIVTCPVSSSLTGVSSQSGCDKMSSMVTADLTAAPQPPSYLAAAAMESCEE